jgi:hypothetical protein
MLLDLGKGAGVMLLGEEILNLLDQGCLSSKGATGNDEGLGCIIR